MLLKLTADRHEAHAASLRQLSFLFVQWCVCWTAKYPNRTRTLWSGSCQVRNLWINLDTCKKYLKQEPKKLYTPHHMTTLIGDHWHRSQKFNWYLWARSVYKTDPSNWVNKLKDYMAYRTIPYLICHEHNMKYEQNSAVKWQATTTASSLIELYRHPL